jgi:hypothetical protein
MRRFALVLAMMALGALLACGVASAYEPLLDPEPTMRCDRGGGSCVGTDRRDAIYGSNVANGMIGLKVSSRIGKAAHFRARGRAAKSPGSAGEIPRSRKGRGAPALGP